ncbi:MAG: hypothetical protein PVH87_14910 [Desulfobacteraceae bacterium]
MQLLIYASPFDPAGRSVLKSIGSKNHGFEIHRLYTIKDLEKHLMQPSPQPKIILLIPQNQHDLDHLIAIGYLTRDTKVVLMLPGDDRRINAKAHQLRPRFVGYNYGDPSDFTTVICKLMEAASMLPMQAVR